MSSYEDLLGPGECTWVAAVHESETDYRPLGTAVVIDSDRLLTSAHNVIKNDRVRTGLWAAFPMIAVNQRRPVKSVEFDFAPPVRDLAVLILAEPVPRGVMAARLQCQAPDQLKSKKWWAFGFPDQDPVGNSAGGTVGEALAYGWVRLDAHSRYPMQPGFSGGGIWSEDLSAVVAVVGQVNSNGDGRAITMHQANECFPGHKLADLAAVDGERRGVADAWTGH